MKTEKLLLLLYFLTSSSLIKFSEGILQEVKLYSKKDCTGDSFSITHSQDIPLGSWQASASYLKYTGIWAVHFTHGGVHLSAVKVTHPNTSRCEHRSEFFGSFIGFYLKFERIGPEDTSTSQLLLFNDPSNFGEPLTVTADINDVSASFNGSTNFLKFAHFSNDNWMAYEEKNFKGGKRCFNGEEEEENRRKNTVGNLNSVHDFQIGELNPKTKIGSVRKDRNGECSRSTSSNPNTPNTNDSSSSTIHDDPSKSSSSPTLQLQPRILFLLKILLFVAARKN